MRKKEFIICDKVYRIGFNLTDASENLKEKGLHRFTTDMQNLYAIYTIKKEGKSYIYMYKESTTDTPNIFIGRVDSVHKVEKAIQVRERLGV